MVEPLFPAKSMFEVSIVMPCLNEEGTVGDCVIAARNALAHLGLPGEVIVADNDSADASRSRAKAAGAKIVVEKVRGYGACYLAGLDTAVGRFIVIGDADGTYDFSDLERFVRPLQNGWDMVIGDRLGGEIARGAMPWLNRRIGNPALSRLLNLLFKTGVADAHCGMRSFRRSAYRQMRLRSRGMEFASEMLIEAARLNLKIKEIPIRLRRAPVERVPHLRPFRDGTRHLWLMARRFFEAKEISRERQGPPPNRNAEKPASKV